MKILLLILSFAQAAPLPATSTSQFAQPLLGIYRSEYGFEIDARNTNWILQSNEEKENVVATFLSPGKLNSKLTVRIDETKSAKNLKQYMKKWPSLYQRLGFELTNQTDGTIDSEPAVIVDLTNKSQKRKTRQAIIFQKNHAIILTCSNQAQTFEATATECGKLFKAFRFTNKK